MVEPEYTGSFRKAIFRVGDEPDAPVILKTFLRATPSQGMHVLVKDIEGAETKYEVKDVTFTLEEKVTGGENPQSYHESIIYVDLEEII